MSNVWISSKHIQAHADTNAEVCDESTGRPIDQRKDGRRLLLVMLHNIIVIMYHKYTCIRFHLNSRIYVKSMRIFSLFIVHVFFIFNFSFISFSHRLCASRQISRLSLKETRKKTRETAEEKKNTIILSTEEMNTRCVCVHANMYDNRSSIIDLFSAWLTMTDAVATKCARSQTRNHRIHIHECSVQCFTFLDCLETRN